jgi:exodeoxyribonuclease-5
MEWSPQQEAALRAASAWLRSAGRRPYFTLAGYAGTGKTTLARHLAADAGARVFFAAFTGKAAHVLRKMGIPEAVTIHKLIYVPRDKCGAKLEQLEGDLARLLRRPASEKRDLAREAKVVKLRLEIEIERENLRRPDFFLNSDSPLLGADLLVVDEYSMVDQQMGRDLLSFGCPILALGDPGQLPPVQGAQYFTGEPDVLLTEIHRQARDNPIIRLSAAVREGRSLVPGTYGGSRVLRSREVSDAELGKMTIAADQVLVGMNATRRQWNAQIRKRLGRTSPLPQRGDKLVCLRNNHKEGLLNGQTWVVDRFRAGRYLELVLVGEDGERVTCLAHRDHFERENAALDPRTRREANEFDFGNCLTVHKCVHPDTLVESDQGLLPIRLLSGRGVVATSTGKEFYTNKVHNPEGIALKIECEDRYGSTVTPDHKVEVVRAGRAGMVEAREVRVGDWMRVRLGVSVEPRVSPQMPARPEADVRAKRVVVPSHMSADLAEFLGLMVADGTLTYNLFRLLKRHRDVAKRFGELAAGLFSVSPSPVAFNNATGFEVCSTILAEWLAGLGGLSPHQKKIPECVLRSSSAMHAAFLRGLFEDGTVNVKTGVCDHIELSASSDEMMSQAQVMLLRLGIISSVVRREGWSVLYIYGRQAGLFRDRVGFIAKFKQDRLGRCRTTSKRYRVPLSREQVDALFPRSTNVRQRAIVKGYASRSKLESLGEAAADLLGWHWVRVRKIEEVRCESMCVEVLPSHRFLQNGFPHGNSQGSQWDRVLVLDEWRGSGRTQWLYTALTRAAQGVTVIV